MFDESQNEIFLEIFRFHLKPGKLIVPNANEIKENNRARSAN
jgi:16S rRNA C1402 N4-methylase RsmH